MNKSTFNIKKTSLVMNAFGLLSITCITKPNKHHKLLHEINDFFLKYRCNLNTLQTGEQCNCHLGGDTDKIDTHLYRPRFINLLGQADLRVDVLVDDFELLNALPNFEFAAKQKATIHFIPNLTSNLEDNDLPTVLIDPMKYFNNTYIENLEAAQMKKLMIQSKPFQYQIFCKLDTFIFTEFGLELILLLFKNLFAEFQKLNQDDTFKVLPLINFEWHEIGFNIYTKSLRTSEKITKCILNSRLSNFLDASPVKERLINRCRISFLKCQLLTHLNQENYELATESYGDLKKLVVDIPKLTDFLKYDKLEKLSCINQNITENIFFTVFLEKPNHILKFEDLYKWDSIFSKIHPILSTRTLFGFPSELFLYLLIKKDTNNITLNNFIKKYLDTIPITDTSTISMSDQKRKEDQLKNEASFIYAVGSSISTLELDNSNDVASSDVNCKEPFLATMDLKILSYKLYDPEILNSKDNNKLHISYGSHEVRKVFKSQLFIDLLTDIAYFHESLGQSFYGTTITQLFHEPAPEILTNSSVPLSDKIGYKKIHLSSFANYNLETDIHKTLSAIHFPKNLHHDLKYIFKSFNSNIQDTYLFENAIELYPVIRKLYDIIQHIPTVLESEPFRRKILEADLSKFVQHFKSSIEKNYYNVNSDLSPFTFNIDTYSNMQKFLWIASGIQRSLMSIYYSGNDDAITLRACVLCKGETNEILQQLILLPFIRFNIYHISAPESLNILFHEIGHFYKYSDWWLAYKETCKKRKTERDILSQCLNLESEEPLPRKKTKTRSYDYKNEIYDEIIPDIFYLIIGCKNDYSTFLNKFFIHIFSTTLYPDLISNSAGVVKNQTDESDIHLFHRHIFRFAALLWVTGKTDPIEKPDESTQTLYNYLTKCSLLSHLGTSAIEAQNTSNTDDFSNPYSVHLSQRYASRINEKLILTFNPTAIKAFNKVFVNIHSIFKEKIFASKPKDNSAESHLDEGVVTFYSHIQSNFHSFKQTTQLLCSMFDSIIKEIKDSPFPTLKSKTSPSDIQTQRGMGPDLNHWHIPKSSPIIIHPSFGLTIRTNEARKLAFLRRSATMLSLMDISIQSRASLIQEAIRKPLHSS